jgi:hypothetical protein
MKRTNLLFAVLTVVGTSVATAQNNYSGGTYSENFDGMFKTDGTGQTFSPAIGPIGTQGAIPTLPTWRAARVAGTGTGNFALFADWGGNPGTTSSNARLYSYGWPASWGEVSNDRALGSIASGTLTPGLGTFFINTSSSAFGSITISFDREVWRNQNLPNDQSLSFAYGLSSSGILDTDFLTHNSMTLFPSLNATCPAGFASDPQVSYPQTGNPNYSQSVSATITGVNWAPGETLFIRWTDFNDDGNDAGISIDNLTMIAAVPEPCSGLLLGLGLATLALARRHAR